MKTRLGLIAASLALATAAPAQAATLFSQTSSTGQIASPGSRSFQFESAGGTGQIAFDLEGYRSIDGIGSGPFDDLFTLSLNGAVLSSAYYRLGGIGSTQNVSGAPATSVVDRGFNNGGTATYNFSTLLASGTNTLTFAYSSATPQGVGDEAWGVRNLVVTGNAPAGDPVTAVPEPATWAMMLVGFGFIGGSMRRRREAARVRFA